jgi:hypothetical protein
MLSKASSSETGVARSKTTETETLLIEQIAARATASQTQRSTQVTSSSPNTGSRLAPEHSHHLVGD